MSKDVRQEPLKSVIRNCQRLITDAEILLEKGSSGSACSLAIMAFEEAGKGHSHELDIKRNRKTKINSSHQYRHLMCALVLMISLQQKYGLKPSEFTEEQQDKINERFAAAATFSEFASSPAPDEIRSVIGKQVFDQLDALPHDQRIIAYVEMNWLRKMAKACMIGDVERLRQKGFYVDFDEQGLLSHPNEVTKTEAFTWIWAAKRAVNLLAFGIYYQPYSELAALLESMPKPLPDIEEIFKMTLEFAKRGAGEPESNMSCETKDAIRPYEPFGEAISKE